LDNGRYNLIIDLNNINYINSGGLRCLVSAWRRTKAQNGDIVLFGLNDRILEVFTMVGFDKIFHIVDTSLEAQAVFQQE
jgi:anti-anti-sigma factor